MLKLFPIFQDNVRQIPGSSTHTVLTVSNVFMLEVGPDGKIFIIRTRKQILLPLNRLIVFLCDTKIKFDLHKITEIDEMSQ